MKHFLIKYRFQSGSEAEWHQHIARFIAALEGDPALNGKIAYRCMKRRDGDEYWHLASATDDDATRALSSRDFFKQYTEATKLAGGGSVEVVPLEIIAETVHRA